MPQAEYNVSLVHRLAGWIGAGFIHLVALTSAIQKVDHPSFLEFRRRRRPVIYAFWHNNQVFLAWAHRGEPVSVIVSRSKDGEYIAQVMKRLHVGAVRGSSSRGGDSAFRQLCSLIEKGEQVAFTPDGPRGPVQTVQPGVVAAAQITGAPIVPVAVASRRKLVFRSWDRFFVPLPFSHIVVHHGKPFWIPSDEPPATAAQRVREALNAAVDSAQAAEREAPSWWTSFAGAFLGRLYSVLGFLFSPLALPVFLWQHGFQRTFRNLDERLNPGGLRAANGRRLWLHAASVGEWQALRPVLRELKKNARFSFVLTVSSPEARSLVATEEPDLPVRMIPLDFSRVVKGWIRRMQPDAIVITETELWPNLVQAAHRTDVPLFIVNGRLSQKSASHWAFVRPLAWRILSCITHFYVRTDVDGRRYCSISAPVSRVTVTGNTKVDNLEVLTAQERAARRLRFFGDTPGVILLGGSTWPGEETVLARMAGMRDGLRVRVVIAPRSKNRFEEVARDLSTVAASWSRWSDEKTRGHWDTDILLVDTLGDLKNLYGACDLAFVGGSLNPRGGQNPLEPAAAGLPVLFGPSMKNFHEEAAELKKVNGARESRHASDLESDVRELASSEDLRRSMGAAAAQYVQSRQGAARRTAEAIAAALLIEGNGV